MYRPSRAFFAGNKVGQANLSDVSEYWPTPTSTDSKASGAQGYSTESGRHSGTTLTDAAVRQPMWATPNARDHKGQDMPGRHGGCSLPHQVMLMDGEPSSTSTRTSRPRLNPAFAAWLMGWAWWWTHPEQINCAASAMASYRSRLRLLLAYCCGG